MAAERAALEIAETIQTAHINRHPDPAYDVNPSSTASQKLPVRIGSHTGQVDQIPDENSVAADEIPISILQPQPRKPALPPLPDLRFEQSYLARIKPYSDRKEYGRVAWYTFWDHVVMPLTQGMLWRLVVFGWRHWNTATQFRGHGVGARLRRWWWGVNGWHLPGIRPVGLERGVDGRDDLQEFVVAEFGNAGAD